MVVQRYGMNGTRKTFGFIPDLEEASEKGSKMGFGDFNVADSLKPDRGTWTRIGGVEARLHFRRLC